VASISWFLVMNRRLATALTFSMTSSFLGRQKSFARISNDRFAQNKLVMYDSSYDPPSSPEFNAWTVLSNTERWICRTLADSNAAAGGNPYTRKEVSYSCETSPDGPMVVTGIFRRLKEARQLGENHGAQEEEQRIACQRKGMQYRPHTLRKTEVVVIPANTVLSQSFATYDKLIEAINRARRNARDYVTDTALERNDERLYGDDVDKDSVQDWSVSVNCAHLHPQFGQLTPEQELEQLREEEASGEVDVHQRAYREKRMEARRSPYPTIVVEVRSIPPPDFGVAPPPPSTAVKGEKIPALSSGEVSRQDIQKLEALFGKSAYVSHPSKVVSPQEEDDAFYKAIEDSFDKAFTALRPLNIAQQWIALHDLGVMKTASFTESTTPDVDAAYEFVFTNVAMLNEGNSKQYYLVMPNFLSAAATSFEKFSGEVINIISCIPDAPVRVTTFHPEHIDSKKRSPSPILKLEWTD